MKIALFVCELDQIGGAEIATMRLAERMSRYGHIVAIITTSGLRQEVLYRYRRTNDYTKGVRVIRLPVWQRDQTTFVRMLFAQASWALPLYLRQTDVLHLRGLMPATVMLARIAQRMGIRTLCTPMASGDNGDAAKYPSDLRRGIHAFDRIVALTETIRDEVVQAGYPPERIFIIPNGIDPNYFKPSERPQSKPRVVFVGQFRPEKRIDLLLQAWKSVQIDCPQAKLTLVGGGRCLPEYQQRAATLGVSPTFVPNTDPAGVLAQLQMGSIYIAPGISEGMSNALLEAMAVGLAPIVADTPASRAVISSGINGLLYPAESSQALAEQIKRLIANDLLRQRLGDAARQTVLRRFDHAAVTDQHIALYEQLLSEAR